MVTCYNVFRREIMQSIHREEDHLGFEPEITATVAKWAAGYIMSVSPTVEEPLWKRRKSAGKTDSEHYIAAGNTNKIINKRSI